MPKFTKILFNKCRRNFAYTFTKVCPSVLNKMSKLRSLTNEFIFAENLKKNKGLHFQKDCFFLRISAIFKTKKGLRVKKDHFFLRTRKILA